MEEGESLFFRILFSWCILWQCCTWQKESGSSRLSRSGHSGNHVGLLPPAQSRVKLLKSLSGIQNCCFFVQSLKVFGLHMLADFYSGCSARRDASRNGDRVVAPHFPLSATSFSSACDSQTSAETSRPQQVNHKCLSLCVWWWVGGGSQPSQPSPS